MPEVYLTADGARELILTLQRQIRDALTTLDEAIRLLKARTAEADASHALAIHNFKCANEHERERKVWEKKFCDAALELDALNQNTGRLRVRLEQTERELADTQQKFQPLLRQVELLRAERDDLARLLESATAPGRSPDASEANEHPQRVQGRG